MQGVTLEDFEDLRSVTAALERFPIRLTRKLQGSWPESALDSMFVAFPIGKPVSTFPGNALSHRCGAALKTVCLALAQFVGDCSNRLQPTSYGELQQERTNHSNGGKSP